MSIIKKRTASAAICAAMIWPGNIRPGWTIAACGKKCTFAYFSSSAPSIGKRRNRVWWHGGTGVYHQCRKLHVQRVTWRSKCGIHLLYDNFVKR